MHSKAEQAMCSVHYEQARPAGQSCGLIGDNLLSTASHVYFPLSTGWACKSAGAKAAKMTDLELEKEISARDYSETTVQVALWQTEHGTFFKK